MTTRTSAEIRAIMSQEQAAERAYYDAHPEIDPYEWTPRREAYQCRQNALTRDLIDAGYREMDPDLRAMARERDGRGGFDPSLSLHGGHGVGGVYNPTVRGPRWR